MALERRFKELNREKLEMMLKSDASTQFLVRAGHVHVLEMGFLGREYLNLNGLIQVIVVG